MEKSRKVAMIVNPVAGSGEARDVLTGLRERLLDAGHPCDTFVSESADDLERLVALHATGDTIIAVAGGDGTIHTALRGLLGKPNPLLIIPLGTENLLATQLGIYPDPESIWRTLTEGRQSPFDLALINGRPFATVVGAGFDAEVVARLTRDRRGHISYFDYFWPLWRTFWQYRFPSVRVIADGQMICDEPALVFVGNISRYATGLQILRHARWDDGLLDLCVMRCGHQGPLLEHAFWTLLNWHVEHPLVTYKQVRRVRIEADQPLPLQCDGDPAGELPAEIEVLPAAINVMVSPDAAPAAVAMQISA